MKSLAALFSFAISLNMVVGQHIPVMHDGNEKTPISHLQYIASLQLTSTEESFFCSGVFISHKAVLTLASCFYQNDALLQPGEVRVVAGSQFRLDKERNTFSGVLEGILIHENFSRSSLESNLAIGFLELWAPDDNIQIVDLEDIAINAPIEGTKCEIYGWSLTTFLGYSPHLLSGDVVIEQREMCDVATNKITSTTICAGPYSVNGCETDDGAPLFCNKKLFGLIDYRPPHYCSVIHTTRLGTYVDLSGFHDWISEHSAAGRTASSVLAIALMSLIVEILCTNV